MLPVNPVILLTNAAIPDPSEVKLPTPFTGLGLVPQHTPLSMIGAPPSLVIAPPEVAVFAVILVIAAVDATMGAVAASVVKLNSGP